MNLKEDLKMALAICAAIVGAGFASGREIVTFFAGLGAASWLGVAIAGAGIGYLCYVLMRLARQTGAAHLPGLYGALMGDACRDAMFAVYGLLATVTAAAMLAAGGELGALALPVRSARAIGVIATLLVSVVTARFGMGGLGFLGAALAPATVCYYVLMAVQSGAPTEFSNDGLLIAVPMGMLYAALNAALAAGAICLAGRKITSPARAAIWTGVMIFLMLGAANWAMLRAGEDIRAMALPSVILAARWGTRGYYVSILIMWLAVTTTLCAMLCSMQAQGKQWKLSDAASLALACAVSLLVSVCGFHTLVSVAYPLLGWLCAIALVALPLFLRKGEPADERMSLKRDA